MAKNIPWAWKKIYFGSEEGPVSKISNSTQKVMSLKLNKLLQEFNPDLVISTHPFSSQMCSILKQKGNINCKIATIITDYAPHGQWLVNPDQINYFFVAHDGMKDNLILRGIDSNKIYVTGIPLSNRFLGNYNKEKILSDFGLSINKRTILFFAGGEYGFGKDKTYKILKTLIAKFSNMQIIAIAGRNIKMKHHFDELVDETQSNEIVKVLEFTNKIPELMSVSDLVISKPRRINNNRKPSLWSSNYSN